MRHGRQAATIDATRESAIHCPAAWRSRTCRHSACCPLAGPGLGCGQLSGTIFVLGPQCVIGEPQSEQFSFTFAAPLQPGVIALALFTCGTQVLADATNRLCGTWYANVEVRGAPAR